MWMMMFVLLYRLSLRASWYNGSGGHGVSEDDDDGHRIENQ